MAAESEMLPAMTLGGGATTPLPVESRVTAGARALLALAAPLVITRASLAMMGFVDAVMLAHYASSELAALALAEGTYGRLLDVSVAAVASGLVTFPLAAELGGKAGQHALWHRLAKVALALGMLVALASLAAEPILTLAGQDPKLVATAAAVIRTLAIAAPTGLLAIATAVYLEGTQRAALVAYVLVAANLVNLGLNYLLINGYAGFPALGAVGSAISTATVRIMLSIVLVAIVLRLEGRTALSPAPLNEKTSRRQMQISAAAAGTSGGMHALGSILTMTGGWLGTLSLAAYSSCWTVNLPGMLIALGLADAVASRSAQSRGRTLGPDLKTAATLIAGISAAIVVASPLISAAYSADPALTALIGSMLPFSGTVLLLDAVSYTIVTSLRGLGDMKWPIAIQLSGMTLTPILAITLAHGLGLGVAGMVYAVFTTSMLQCSLLLYRYRLNAAAREAQGS